MVGTGALSFNSVNLNIEKAFEISKNLILVGDLNEDLLNPNYHNLKDLILVNSMKNVITEPTRQHAILDPIIIPEDFPFLDSGTIGVPDHISDHKATYINLPFHLDQLANLHFHFTSVPRCTPVTD